MYIPKNFTLEELVHPDLIKRLGSTNCWRRIDSGLLEDIDKIRDKWFSITSKGLYVNTLWSNPVFDSRGYRPPNDTDGAYDSSHKQGKAFDLVPISGDYRVLYKMIYRMIQKGEFKSINTLEDVNYTKGWVHVAFMNTYKRPLIIKP